MKVLRPLSWGWEEWEVVHTTAFMMNECIITSREAIPYNNAHGSCSWALEVQEVRRHLKVYTTYVWKCLGVKNYVHTAT